MARTIEELRESLVDKKKSGKMVRHRDARVTLQCSEIKSICESNINHPSVKTVMSGIENFPDDFKVRVMVATLKAIMHNKELVLIREDGGPFEDQRYVLGKSLTT